MKFDGFTKTMVMNCVSIVAGSIAIATACKVTKSAVPLVAFTLIPQWAYTNSRNRSKKGEE